MHTCFGNTHFNNYNIIIFIGQSTANAKVDNTVIHVSTQNKCVLMVRFQFQSIVENKYGYIDFNSFT